MDCGTQIIKKEGIKRLYTGFGISCSGVLIYRALYFGCYDSAKETMLNENLKDSFFVKLPIAYMSTSIAYVFSFPLDILTVIVTLS